LNRGNKTAKNVEKNLSLSTTYNGDMTHLKTPKIMNCDITLEAR